MLIEGRRQASVRRFKRVDLAVLFPTPRHTFAAWVLVGLILAVGVGDAAASSLSGALTSIGFIGTILTIVLAKSWLSNPVAGSLSTLAAFLAFAVGAAVLIRARGVPGSHSRRIGRLPPAVIKDCPGNREGLPVSLPPGFDQQNLMEEFRSHFLALHSAWDVGATEVICKLTTPAMLHEFNTAREAAFEHLHPSRFLTLNVNILLFEERQTAQIACVEYHGVVEEAVGKPATPFRELWMLTRSTAASLGDWRLTRHQGLF